MSDGDDKEFRDEMKESARRVWLAGLGALAVAEEEGAKVFRKLVEKGGEVSSRGRDELRHQLDGLRDRLRRGADDAERQGDRAWERLERRFEELVERSMRRSGLPTEEEVERLRAHVEELTRQVEALRARRAAAAATPTAPPPAAGSPDAKREGA